MNKSLFEKIEDYLCNNCDDESNDAEVAGQIIKIIEESATIGVRKIPSGTPVLYRNQWVDVFCIGETINGFSNGQIDGDPMEYCKEAGEKLIAIAGNIMKNHLIKHIKDKPISCKCVYEE